MSEYFRSHRDEGRWPALAWWPLLALVVLASVIRGGNRGVALVALEWLALAAALGWALGVRGLAWPASWGTGWPRALRVALVSAPLWLGVWQLTPWPGLGRISTVPEATAFALLAGVPVVVCLAAAMSVSRAQMKTLLRVWACVALAQAVLGVAQLAAPEPLHFGLVTAEKAIGTLASKNTYANLLVMGMVLCLMALFEALKERRGHGVRRAWFWGIGAVVLMSVVMISTSRTGIATGFLVLLLGLGLMWPRTDRPPQGRRALALGLVVVLALVGLLVLMGGLDWVQRFDDDRLLADSETRASLRSVAAALAWQAFPWGTGVGSFAWVSSASQPAALGQFWINLAHNDYAQWLADTGLAGVLVLAAAVALLVRRASRWEGGTLSTACALGLLAVGLHAWVDYPFHIPVNSMLAATLLGWLLREPE